MRPIWEENITTDDEKGFSAGANTSFVNTYVNFVKEFFQNTLDQRKKNNKEKVRVEINLKNLPSNKFPQVENYKEILKHCRDVGKQEPANKFFDKCINLIGSDIIPVLVISEYNTTGLIFEEGRENCNWYTFMRSSGLSMKGAGEGGSYGVGKTAIWNLSHFRTIFVSSYYNECSGFLFQGKTNFIDYKKNSQDRYSGSVYCGDTNKLPITDAKDLDAFFHREKEDGTTFFIPFPKFQDGEDWKVIFTKVLLNFFWYAIYNDELEVNVSGVLINQSNLEALMSQYFRIEDRDDKKHEQDWNPLPYYLAVSKHQDGEPNHFTITETNFRELGSAKLFLMFNQNFVSKVMYMRNNHMVIQKITKGRLSTKPFAAVFITDDKNGSDLLRQMESPEHDEWKEDYARERNGGELPPKYKTLQSELTKFINDGIKKATGINASEEGDFAGMENFIETDSVPGKETKEETFEEIDVENSFDDEVSSITKQTTIDGVVSGRIDNESEKPGVKRVRTGVITTKKKRKQPINNDLESTDEFYSPINIDARSFAILNSNSKVEHVIVLKSEKDVKCSIKIITAGDSGDEDGASINTAYNLGSGTPYEIHNNRIENVVVFKGMPLKISTILENGADKYRLKIEAYANK